VNPLRQKIEQEIRDRGPIPFSRYMELCLYDPDHGYYSRHANQFGKAGDFFTSSDVHAVFGRLLARQFEEMWRVLPPAKDSPENVAREKDSSGKIEIVELGPGRGLFARDVLDWSEKTFPDFFRTLTYKLVEQSPALRARLTETLSRHLASGKASIATSTAAQRRKNADHGASRGSRPEEWNQAAQRPKNLSPEDSIRETARRENTHEKIKTTTVGNCATSVAPSGVQNVESSAPEVPQIIFANEFLDALPVEILSTKGSLRIDTQNHQFTETWAPPSPEELEFLDRYSIHPEEHDRIEVPLAAQHYAEEIFSRLTKGFAIFIDYGLTRDEQLAGRHRNTLKAIRQHSISTNPYEAPGEQDLTADVNFTALAAAAQNHGLQTYKLLTQSQFLMGIGESTQFADAFAECRLPQERAKVALQLKHLVTPAGMGESFHVLIASKGIEKEKAANLSGLTFGHNVRS